MTNFRAHRIKIPLDRVDKQHRVANLRMDVDYLFDAWFCHYTIVGNYTCGRSLVWTLLCLARQHDGFDSARLEYLEGLKDERFISFDMQIVEKIYEEEYHSRGGLDEQFI